MHYETVSLRDVLSILRGSRRSALMTAREEYMMDNPEYVRHMDRELQNKLGNAIAREIDPSFPTFAGGRQELNQRSIETWVLTREQHDAIVMVLMKLAEKMKTYEVRLPVYGELDANPQGRDPSDERRDIRFR